MNSQAAIQLYLRWLYDLPNFCSIAFILRAVLLGFTVFAVLVLKRVRINVNIVDEAV
jgi:hypothetical protein